MLSAGAEPLLAVRQLSVVHRQPPKGWFGPPRRLRAVDELNLNLYPGETLGLVGESGSGKSTLARALVGLVPAGAGSIRLGGRELTRMRPRQWREVRRTVQMVFQDPLGSLDPCMRVGDSVAEPLEFLCGERDPAARRRRVAELFERVGLTPGMMERFPHELSGGQCQRVGIARALAPEPQILICDEAVSALDATTRQQILELLRSLQQEFGLSMLFISHDLSVVRALARRVLVMYYGRVMEQAETQILFEQPRHPYTKALLASAPGTDPARRRELLLDGPPPDVSMPAQGCVFTSRCPLADQHCLRQVPVMRRLAGGGGAACHYIADGNIWPSPAATPA